MDLQSENYNHLVEELNAILVEGVYNSNLTLLETYHHFGSVLAQHERTYGDGFTKRVSKDLGKSQSTVQKCIRFATLYPDIQTLLDQYDKTLTWRRVANEILIEKKEEPKLISEPVQDVASCIRANLKFLIETAEVKSDGVHLFLPKDMCDLPIDNN